MSFKVQVFEDPRSADQALAGEIADLLRSGPAVLGLATGGTPRGLYAELVRRHREEGLDFSRVTTFNLDEFRGPAPSHPASFRSFMREHLFRHVNVDPARTHLPEGNLPPGDLDEHCDDYERLIREVGGIDLQLLGIGSNGHIGFNEPGSMRDSRTRQVELAASTRRAYAASFPDEPVPTHAVTMGVATILEARRLRLIAYGERKAEAIDRLLNGPVSGDFPASFLRGHPNVTLVLDRAAAGRAERSSSR